MKKVICLLTLSLLFLNVLTWAEEIKPEIPIKFRCKVLEERYDGEKLKSKSSLEYYQFDNLYRVDVMGFTYIIDDNKKILYSLYGNQYIEEQLNGEVAEYLNFCGFGFLNPNNFKTIDTGKKEIIIGYECEVKEVITEEKETKTYIWQAPVLGDLALKYEYDRNNGRKTIRTVVDLNQNFTDISMFKLPTNGKAEIILIDPNKLKN